MKIIITILAFLVSLGGISYIFKVTNIPGRFCSENILKGKGFKTLLLGIYIPIIILAALAVILVKDKGYYTIMITICVFIGLADGIYGSIHRARVEIIQKQQGYM